MLKTTLSIETFYHLHTSYYPQFKKKILTNLTIIKLWYDMVFHTKYHKLVTFVAEKHYNSISKKPVFLLLFFYHFLLAKAQISLHICTV